MLIDFLIPFIINLLSHTATPFVQNKNCSCSAVLCRAEPSGTLQGIAFYILKMLGYELEVTFKVISSNKMNKKPTKGQYLEILLRSPKTIFYTKDVALLWGEEKESTISARLNKYAKSGKLIRVHRGFYAKDKNYNRFELATRVYTPSYISFETVLTSKGINFQYYGNIFVASYVNREITIGKQRITFVRMKDYVLSNIMGIEHKEGYARAIQERAFLDRIYISKDYHFDNLSNLNWDKVFEILPIYHNKRLNKKVEEYFKYYKNNSSA